ncbi:MAG: Clp protease N-terminal domain-containing protein [Galbitalea sp.]
MVSGDGTLKTGHLLLGVLGEPDSFAASVLAVLGVRGRKLRNDCVAMLAAERTSGDDEEGWIKSESSGEHEAALIAHPAERIWSMLSSADFVGILANRETRGASTWHDSTGMEFREYLLGADSASTRSTLRIEESDPGRVLAFKWTGPSLSVTTLTLQRVGENTELTMNISTPAGSSAPRELRRMHTRMKLQLHRLQQALDSGQPLQPLHAKEQPDGDT